MNARFYALEPEVAGGVGKQTVFDRSAGPFTILELHYEFAGWLGDHLLETVGSFIVTTELAGEIARADFVGCRFEGVKVSRRAGSGLYADEESRGFPNWKRLCVTGQPLQDDFGLRSGVLVVSQRALETLQRYPLNHCGIYNASDATNPAA